MIRKYQKGDWRLVDVQVAQIDEAMKLSDDNFDGLEGYSVIDEERVWAVFGFRVVKCDEAECFALLGEKCGKKLIEMVRFWQRKIPEEMKKRKIKRLTMTVKRGFYEGERLADMLGFLPRGNLRDFFNGNDYQLFERGEICMG